MTPRQLVLGFLAIGCLVVAVTGCTGGGHAGTDCDALCNANEDAGVNADVDAKTHLDAGADASTPDYNWSLCSPTDFRWLNDNGLLYLGGSLRQITEVIEDAATYEEHWQEFFAVTNPGPPEVDFSAERTAWFSRMVANQSEVLRPEVRRCAIGLVFRPRIMVLGGEMPSNAITVIALPLGEDPIYFGEPIFVE